MQGLADGYFVLPYTLPNYLAGQIGKRPSTDHPEFKARRAKSARAWKKLLEVNGKRSVDSFHRELGLLLWDKCGMARNAAGLREALGKIPRVARRILEEVSVPGEGRSFNQSLERAGRVADFLEFAELMCIDALERDESCGGHFREEHQTPDGEALRDDENFAAVFAWEFQGNGKLDAPKLHREPLILKRCILRRGATNELSTVSRRSGGQRRSRMHSNLAAETRIEGIDYEATQHFAGHLVSGDARYRQRATDGRAKNRSRSIPIVAKEFAERARSTINGEAHGPDHPAAACQLYMRSFQRRRDDHGRAVSRETISVDQGSGGRSQRARSHRAGRRFHRGARRFRAGSKLNSGPETQRRSGDGSGGVHRLRRLRRGLSERIGHAVHLRESFASRVSAAGRTGTRPARAENGAAMDAEGFGNCTNTYECEAVCPAEISASFIAKLNREYAIASLRRSAGE